MNGKRNMAVRVGVLAASALLLGCEAPSSVRVLPADDPALGQLNWLAGAWVTEPAPGRDVRIEEHWTQPSAGGMFGINRTMAEGGTVFYEFLRIETNPDGIAYLAAPKGRYPPTPFSLVELAGRRAVFENPDHDFPQRIIYWREGDRLFASVEGLQDGESRQENWSYVRAIVQGE